MKVVIGFAFMISFTVAANLLMKMGAMAAVGDTYLTRLMNLRTIIGLGCFGVAGLTYAWLLKYVSLYVAQSFAAVQYIAVILASALVLSDPISPVDWLGISLIAAGVALVGTKG